MNVSIAFKAMRRITAAGVAAALILTLPGASAIAAETRLIGAAKTTAAQRAFQPQKLVALALPVGVNWKTIDAAKLPPRASNGGAAPLAAIVAAAPAAANQAPSSQAAFANPAETGLSPDEQPRTPSGRKWKSLSEIKGWLGQSRGSDLQSYQTASDKPGLGRRLGRAAVTAAVIASPAAAQPFSLSAVAPSGSILAVAGDAGNLLGNGLAFFFSPLQVHQTFKDGHSRGTPAWKVKVLVSASLALGLVSAPLAGNFVWALQNIFSGLMMQAVPMLGSWFSDSRRKSQEVARLGREHPWKATMITSAVAMALSLGLYAATATVIPAALARVFSQAALGNLTLAISVVTGGMYLMLFLPDIHAVMRGQEPKGFTPAFSLAFFVSCVARTVWTLQTALFSAPYSAQWKEYLFLTGLNLVYAAVSLASYFIAKKHLKKAS